MDRINLVPCTYPAEPHLALREDASYDPVSGEWMCDECAELYARRALEEVHRSIDERAALEADLAAQAEAEAEAMQAHYATATYDDPPF